MSYNQFMGRNSRKSKRNQQTSETTDNKNRKTGFYYSFLTLVLIFCLIQIGYGAILNISKIISYKGKTITLENVLKRAKLRNEDLKAEKKMVTSDNSLEGIARNNLKMAGQDEILIIINKKVEKPKKKKKFKLFSNLKLKKEKQNTDTQTIETPAIPEQMDEE